MATPGMGSGLRRRDPRLGWLVVAFGALGVFVLVTVAVMSWPAFTQLDSAISAWIRSWRSPFLDQAAAFFTTIGSAKVVLPVAIVLALWMLVRRNWRGVIYVVMTVGVGWALGNYVVKNIIQRPRPVGVNIAPILNGPKMTMRSLAPS